MLKLIGFRQQIIVEPMVVDQKETSNGLIAMPSTLDQEVKHQGKVISLSDEIEDLKVGDTVVYGAYSGDKIDDPNGKKKLRYISLLPEHILALIK